MAEEANTGDRVFGASLVNTGFSRIFFWEGGRVKYWSKDV